MTKKERVERVLNGQDVDYPPVSLWYHFGVQHAAGEPFAKISLDYFKHYDFDFLKLMNDYFYPRPDGLDAVRTKADLKQIRPLDVERAWHEQLKAIRTVHQELKDTAYFLDTVFDPWQSIKRAMAGENMQDLMDREPEALLDALDIVAENLIAYCNKSIESGTSGIFMSLPAASEIVSREDFLKFIKPFSVKVFEAISPLSPMNTAHIHGNELYFDEVLDLPVAVFSWWDRGPDGPSMETVKAKTGKCVMGGIDHKIVSRNTRAYLKEHVRQGRRLGGDKNFFLANGCSIDTWVCPDSIAAIVEAAREPL